MKRIKLLLALALAALSIGAAAQTYRDLSGTITTGGTSQVLDAANPTRGLLTISNPSTASEVLCVNVTSAASCSAAGSWVIPAGGTLTIDSKEIVNIVAATTGHVFTAKANAGPGFAMTGAAGGGGGAVTQSGTWSVRAQDGAGNALTSAVRGSERPLSVQIVDGSGAQITAFGGSGGTASNFGSAVPSAGTAAGFSDGTNMQAPRAFDGDSGGGTQYVAGTILRKVASGGTVEAGTSSDPLRTDPTGTTTQPISGTVTANVGTGTQAVSAASGALASGSIASGAMVDLGAQADAAAAADNSTASLIALVKRNNQNQTTMTAAINADPTTAAPVAPATATATKSLLQACQYASAGVTFTDGQQGRVSCDDKGRVVVTLGSSDACQTNARSYAPIDIVTATTTRIITPTASQKAYICSMFLFSAGTNNVGVVEGTGGTCGSGTAGIIGGATAAEGPNLTAQVGFVLPNTGYAQAATAGTNVDVCLITSAAVQLSGHVVYVKAP